MPLAPTDAAKTTVDADEHTPLPIVPALIVMALIAAWVLATVVWGFSGYIVGADISVLLVFGYILSLTKL